MTNLIIRSANTHLEIPSSSDLEITKGGLKLTLSFNAKGGFTLTQNGTPVAAAGAVASAQGMTPGTVMPDGTIYAGVSPDTGRAFYATLLDAPEPLEWADAQRFARESTAHGHNDWRVPTYKELNVLFNNRVAMARAGGGFNPTDNLFGGWYCSSSELGNDLARYQRFSDGYPHHLPKNYGSSVRCVRG